MIQLVLAMSYWYYPKRKIKCEWCNKIIYVPRKRKFNAIKYCCSVCRLLAYLKKRNEAQKRYLKRIPPEERYKRGYLLGFSKLKSHRIADEIQEYKTVHKEWRRLCGSSRY